YIVVPGLVEQPKEDLLVAGAWIDAFDSAGEHPDSLQIERGCGVVCMGQWWSGHGKPECQQYRVPVRFQVVLFLHRLFLIHQRCPATRARAVACPARGTAPRCVPRGGCTGRVPDTPPV